MKVRLTLTLLVLLSLIFNSNDVRAQETDKKSQIATVTGYVISISGKVVDSKHEPIPGAIIRPEHKNIGVVTDINGYFWLDVEQNSNIIISFLGMQTKKVYISKATDDIMIVLEYDDKKLDEIVVTGYAEIDRRRLAGSVGSLNAEQIKGIPTANLDMLLQGKLTGVDVRPVTGRPGSTATIRIRGTSTLTGDAEPLWVIDGVPLERNIPSPETTRTQMTSGNFDDIFQHGIAGINPNDIESINVLKDAAAAAIYGTRAGAGVIVVTTKRGKEGKMSINYSANMSVVTKPSRDENLMNSSEKLAWEQELWDEFATEAQSRGAKVPIVGITGMVRDGFEEFKDMTQAEQDKYLAELGSTSTNWFDELFQTSVSTDHNLSLSGGSKNIAYYISLGYSNNKGLQKKSEFNRYSTMTNLDIKASDRVQVGFGFSYSNMKSKDAAPGLTNLYQYAYYANPYEKPYNADGSYAEDKTYLRLGQANDPTYSVNLPPKGFNMMRELNETLSKTKGTSSEVKGNIKIEIIEGLSFNGLASFSYGTSDGDVIAGKETYAAYRDRPFDDSKSKRQYGNIAQSFGYTQSYQVRGQLNYSKTIENHYFNMLGGAEIGSNSSKTMWTKRYGYDPVTGNSANPGFTPDMAGDYRGTIDGLSGQSKDRSNRAAFYMQASYTLKNRYTLQLSGRLNGHSYFGTKEQFNPNGSVGLRWNLDEENFMKPIKPIISSFSLYTSTGYTGNISTSVFPQIVMTYAGVYYQGAMDNYRIGIINRGPNPNLRWEKTFNYDVGLDLGFWNDRITASLGMYVRKIKDMVHSVMIPNYTGFPNQSYNMTEGENKGVEFNINAILFKNRDWNVAIGGNVSHNINRLTKFMPPSGGLYNNIFAEGYPMSGAIFSGKSLGIDPTLGIYMFQLRPDAKIETIADVGKTQNYQYYLGTSTAPTYGTVYLRGSYRKITLAVTSRFSTGSIIKDQMALPSDTQLNIAGTNKEKPPTQLNDLFRNYWNVRKDVTNRWTPDNPITDGYPRLINRHIPRGGGVPLKYYMIDEQSITNGALLQKTSFLKIQTISLSYSLSNETLKKAMIESIAFSFMADNIYTFTSYKGFDPETPGRVYPLPRTFSFGINVSF